MIGDLDSETLIPLGGSTSRVQSIAYSNDGNFLAAASIDGSVRLYDFSWIREKEFSQLSKVRPIILKDLSQENDWAMSARFNKNGTKLLVGYQYGTIISWPTSLQLLHKTLLDKYTSLNDDTIYDIIPENWEIFIANTNQIRYQQYPSSEINCKKLLDEAEVQISQSGTNTEKP